MMCLGLKKYKVSLGSLGEFFMTALVDGKRKLTALLMAWLHVLR